MAQFIVRVELHGKPSEEVYNKLHFSMEAAKFSRTFTDGNPVKTYHFPHAVYGSLKRTETTLQILSIVKAIVKLIWSDSEILVIHTTERWEYDNLKVIKG